MLQVVDVEQHQLRLMWQPPWKVEFSGVLTSFFWEGKKSNSVFSFIFERFQLLGRHFELLWFGEVAIFHEAGDQFKAKYIFQFQSFLVHSVNQHGHGKMDTIYFPGNRGGFSMAYVVLLGPLGPAKIGAKVKTFSTNACQLLLWLG